MGLFNYVITISSKTSMNRIGNKHDPPEERGLPTQSPPAFRASNASTNRLCRGRWGMLVTLAKRLSEIQLKEPLVIEIHRQYIFCGPDTWSEWNICVKMILLFWFFSSSSPFPKTGSDLNWFSGIFFLRLNSFREKKTYLFTSVAYKGSVFTALLDTFEFLCVSL